MIRWNEATARVVGHVRYQSVEPNKSIADASLDLVAYDADGLPEGVDALLLTSDLQARGRMFKPGRSREPLRDPDDRLLGLLVAGEVARLSDRGTLPRREKIAVVLAGDLYARPRLEGRGGLGDVLDVWRALALVSGWVVGVAGNHDLFSNPLEVAPTRPAPAMALLEGHTVTRGGTRIGGVSGIIGSRDKPNRLSEDEFLFQLAGVREARAEVVVLHMGPDASGPNRPGSAPVREALEAGPPALVVCGHAHWKEPFAVLANGTRVINTDCRAVVLVRA